MEKRYFDNPFADFVNLDETPIIEHQEHVKQLISDYVGEILYYCLPDNAILDERGDLYTGNAGIAYMFWKMYHSEKAKDFWPTLDLAHTFISDAKIKANCYKSDSNISDRYEFLCGSAGIYALAAAISHDMKEQEKYVDELKNFRDGIEASKQFVTTTQGCDELLVGRAGYLSGIYWLRSATGEEIVTDDEIISICEMIIKSGRKFAKEEDSDAKLLYQYHGTKYLCAAHGMSSILHMLLQSPWYGNKAAALPTDISDDIKASTMLYLTFQDDEGNFPADFDDFKHKNRINLVHWCYGAPGVIYLLAKAYLQYQDVKYLDACHKAADLVWKKGLLRKGPGLCHGIAGNGYVFLLMYRLTNDMKYFYRATKFMEFLSDPKFRRYPYLHDCRFSLFEGFAGTVCFLIDLLDPKKAHFPFMDIF